VEAWKYAHEEAREPLRRHYLLRAYEAAKLPEKASELRARFAQKVVSEHLKPDRTVSIIMRALGRRFAEFLREWWIPIVALVMASYLLWLKVEALRGAVVVLGVLATFLPVLVLVLSSLIQTALTVLAAGLTVRTEEDPFRSIEDFDEQFRQLLSEDAPDARFVFFIDDLDRCEDDIVVEAIETLQAFFGRQRCTYIVAADEKQLKRAVRRDAVGPADALRDYSAIPSDENFLEKIFQVAVHVPPVYGEGLREYASKVAAETELASFDDAVRDTVLDFLVHPEVISPRQVRVILNEFLLMWAQAKHREAEPATLLPDARLTVDAALFAKMVVLQQHFPWFYRLLYAQPEALLIWLDARDQAPDERSADEARFAELVERAAARASAE
jgi:hypothetical protein